ncbi:peroxide stress protein YaaA [Faucicola atlantae]|uniref:peroxide stress protein YaaA n=1 Tax=Faucicola atlantae TaxID=34059 RepID=UPI0025B0728C|nr:peroxide stress protein YaaA [Moraxella atlantae]
MYFLLSPAKNLDETCALPPAVESYLQYAPLADHQPMLMPQACALMALLKPLDPVDLMALLGISHKLAATNAERNQRWAWDDDRPFTLDHAKPALYLFAGDVYQGLDANSLSLAAVEYLQQHLGILSGLYGVLKPLDFIMPYRLEMGSKLANARGNNLYEFWGNQIGDTLAKRMAQNGDTVLINLASNEYFKAVKSASLSQTVITPRFEDGKNGTYKVISFYAKHARGLMMRYAACHQLKNPEELQNFDLDGYYFVPEASSKTQFVFRREHD